jgi:hypothetical protein
MYNTPLIIATPKSEIKPTAAETLRLMHAQIQERRCPPTSEKGTFTQHQPGVQRIAEREKLQGEDDADGHRQDDHLSMHVRCLRRRFFASGP